MENTDDEMGDALRTLRDQGMRRIVLDLRNNPGGALDQEDREQQEDDEEDSIPPPSRLCGDWKAAVHGSEISRARSHAVQKLKPRKAVAWR